MEELKNISQSDIDNIAMHAVWIGFPDCSVGGYGLWKENLGFLE